MYPRVTLLRLNKESKKKCSLTPLREQGRESFAWIDCSLGEEVEVEECTLLHPDGSLLSPADASRPLLLVDSSWRDLPRVLRGVRGHLHRRSLPSGLLTAYPRKSTTYEDPETGLASIEALHAALCQLGYRDDSLLDGYYFKDTWLKNNALILQGVGG